MSEIFVSSLLFVVGLCILIYSSGWLIQGCVKLSHIFKLTPLFIGVVIVAFGTSAPEAGIGIVAAIKNEKLIALGNVVGSNIANVGLILGVCAVLLPLKVNKAVFKRELPIMVAATLLLYFLSIDLVISRVDGAIFIICFLIFCFVSYLGARKEHNCEEISEFELKKLVRQTNSPFIIFSVTILALLGVVVGADFMVRGGASLAAGFGVSPWLIGITVFAIGTSLPELAASLTASVKKVPSISVGNIVGSNIFNILFVLGIVSLIRPISLEAGILRFELPVLLLFSGVLFTVMRTNYKITRWEGVFMFLGYVTFIIFLLRR
ncbi:MAG: calcium/sodium antiporter [Candidatus Omnitrophota bacterium]|nr:MAG: calcium/sodium antiporter [Candidatus Omnitrophota bacterium]